MRVFRDAMKLFRGAMQVFRDAMKLFRDAMKFDFGRLQSKKDSETLFFNCFLWLLVSIHKIYFDGMKL